MRGSGFDGAMSTLSSSPRHPIAAVGIICLRGADVLLIKRGKPPLKDCWSLPGGRIEWGENTRAAALRELQEETGITAEIIGLVDVVDGLFSAPGEDAPHAHYVLIDFAARWIGGAPRAGDDAAEARFFSPEDLDALGLWSETLRVIAQARALLQAG